MRGTWGPEPSRYGVPVSWSPLRPMRYAGTDQQLLDEQLTGLRDQFESLRALPSASTTIAGDVPALKMLFSGTAESGGLEGELVVGAERAERVW